MNGIQGGMRTVAGVLLALLALPAAGPSETSAAPDEPARDAGFGYVVTVVPGLKTLGVRICFGARVPARLVLDADDALASLTFAAGGGGAPGLRRDGRFGLTPFGVAPGGCVEYGVDLEAMVRADDGGARRVGADVLTRPGRWLLRPAERVPGGVASLTFDLPPGISVSAPWARTADASGAVRWLLDVTVWRFQGHVAFGRFTPEALDVPGGRIELAVLDAPVAATREGLHRWLRVASEAQAGLFGGVAIPRIQVIVLPSGRGRAVHIGMTRMGGGGGVVLHLASDARDEDLPGEWVAVHELAHLGLPPMKTEDAWFYEGVVTWYQEALRARAGIQSETDAWQAIHEGFGRGMRSAGDRTLREESAAMHRTHSYMRVYWSGTALALRMDVEIRRATGGRQSLDDAVRFLLRTHAGATRSYSATELLGEVDAWLGRPVTAPIAAAWLDSTRFPRLDDLYAALGIVVEGEKVRLSDEAPMAAERRRMMAKREAAASPGGPR